MTSNITQDLYNSLKGGDQLAIGLVRVPFLNFRNGNDSYFPLWHLYVGNKEVAIVSHKRTDANVQIYFIENGGLSLENIFSLWKNRLIAGLIVIKNKLANKIKS